MKKTKTINVRMTEEEYQIIKKKADLSDLTVSEYLRNSAIKKFVWKYKKDDIKPIPEGLSFKELLGPIK